MESFIRELVAYIAGEAGTVKAQGIGITVEAPLCPACQKPLRRLKGRKGFFWGCTGFADGCTFRCPDRAGKPIPQARPTVSALYLCPACGKGLIRRPGKKRGQFWWGCSGFPACKQTYPDARGKPDYSKGKEQRPASSSS